MRDDQRFDNPNERGDRRDTFDDALDDIFGLDEPGDTTPSEPEQAAPPLRPTDFDQQSSPQPGHEPQPYSPMSQPGAEGVRGRSWTKIGCFICLGIFGVIFACFVFLFIIGLVVGDPVEPGPSGRTWVGTTASTFPPDWITRSDTG